MTQYTIPHITAMLAATIMKKPYRRAIIRFQRLK